MISIAISLNPQDLVNPDLDLRYLIPEKIESATDGKIQDNGYNYVDGDNIVVYMTTDKKEIIQKAIETIEKETILGNKLAESVVVGVNEGNGYEVVYPKNHNEAVKFEDD